uniref:hypothetical protein n=1 Tax=Alloprevotella sp. TaxID=1872471 RepID=UPI0040258840
MPTFSERHTAGEQVEPLSFSRHHAFLSLHSACKRAYAESPMQSTDFELKKINICFSSFEISA